jgi:NAD-dependent DNA ligase
MGIPYYTVAENRLLSREVMECVPDYCETCGSEIEFTETLRQIFCPNRYCTDKVANRLENMAKFMQVDGWGESTCREVCYRFGLKSPYQVFLLEGKTCEGVADFGNKLRDICSRNRRRVRLWEVVKYGSLPHIGTVAFKIFDGYSSLAEAYEDIERHEVAFIAYKLGISNNETGVMAANIFNILMEYKAELLFGEQQFDIIKPKGKTVVIVITGGVHGFTNKSEYIEYINRRYADKINAVLVGKVTRKTDVLISDDLQSSDNYQKAVALQERGHKIIVTNSRDFLDILENM